MSAAAGGGGNERTDAREGEIDVAAPVEAGLTPDAERSRSTKRQRADPLYRAKKEADRRREERMEVISTREKRQEIDRERQHERKVRRGK
ncbi:hypothetical protein ACHAXA_006672 [Cyclostephanos tholiformis]|uniref:IBB domain-containing protein n=1 Tax=Cyclostephanos tholiformis TaxID=382380 RepID=A0ABD3R4K4_9STRA